MLTETCWWDFTGVTILAWGEPSTPPSSAAVHVLDLVAQPQPPLTLCSVVQYLACSRTAGNMQPPPNISEHITRAVISSSVGRINEIDFRF